MTETNLSEAHTKSWLRRGIFLSLALVFCAASPLRAQTTLGTQTLDLALNKAAFLYSVPNSLSLTQSGNIFQTYTGAITLTYRARTTVNTGSATITVKATTDFPCASGGPCILTPPTAGDALTYSCSGTSGNGFTPCSGPLTISTSTATNVVSVGAGTCTGAGGSCSGVDPDSVTVTFTLTNDPKYKTGTYQATLTWTISGS